MPFPADEERIEAAEAELGRRLPPPLRGWDRFPPDAIAIASDGTGDRLIVAAGSDDIVLWSHEDATTESVDVDWN